VTDQFPEDFPKEKLIASRTADREGIDNSIPDDLLPNLIRVAWFLQSLKRRLDEVLEADVELYLTSGYRCLKLNRHLGSKDTSDHVLALAADIVCSHLEPLELAQFIVQHMVEVGYDKVINEFDRWVHISVRQPMRMLTYTAVKQGFGTAYEPGLRNS